MTVRLTPHRVRKHDTGEGPRPPQPPDSSVPVPTEGIADPVSEVVTRAAPDTLPAPAVVDPGTAGRSRGGDQDARGGAPGADSRIALREARRQRRRTAQLCAAIVAICLGLTIVVVSLARTRPAPSGAIGSSTTASSSIVTSGGTPPQSDPHQGAPASEGGHR